MPAWIADDPDAKAEWEKVVPELLAVNGLALVDRSALASYCQAHAELVWACRTLAEEGRLIDEPIIAHRTGEIIGRRKVPHPAIKMQREAFRVVKQFQSEFGLTPSARTRIRTPPKQQDEQDPLQALIDGHDDGPGDDVRP